MQREELESFLNQLTNKFSEHFEQYAVSGYTLADLHIIPIYSRSISTRAVTNIGTDEDRDIYLVYDIDGWKTIDMTVHTGAGDNQVISQSENKMDINDVMNWIDRQELNERERIVDRMKSINQKG